MDLIADNLPTAFGMVLGEAISRLVDDHDESLDKRAAMLKVDAPKFSQVDGTLTFEFRLRPNRKPPYLVTLTVTPDLDDDGPRDSALDLSLQTEVRCDCQQFQRVAKSMPGRAKCSCTLAIAWWMHEQLSRRTSEEVLLFLSELKTDTVAAGREVVGQLLKLADEAHGRSKDATSRVQWRIKIANSQLYGPVTINPFVQKAKKNSKGWSKGRQTPAFELLRQQTETDPIDGQVAALTSQPGYDMNREHYNLFQAVDLLVGHPNVAWDDASATPIDVVRGEISIVLEPVEIDSLDDEERSGELQIQRESEPSQRQTLYRVGIRVPGVDLDIRRCELVLGNLHPAQPVVLIAETEGNRLVLAALRDRRATRLISYLLKSDLEEVLLDDETAHQLTMRIGEVGSLVRVELPDQLAGPLEEVEAELVFEMRPRGGAGMFVRLSVFDARLQDMLRPGQEPAIVPAITEEGPIRLRRDTKSERQRANEVVTRFGIDSLSPDEPWSWVAETDDQALDLLARLYEAGDSAPRMIWPEGETIRVRGEITPSALRVQIDDSKDWFGLSGTVSVDGREIKLADLLAAVTERRALVRVGDREFAKISDAFRKRLEQLGDTLVSDRGNLKVADAAVPAVQELIGADVPLEATARWHETIHRLESLADFHPEPPDTLDVSFRDYQLEGFRWLSRLSRWGVGGVLADDMGLGKTVQTLGVLVERAAEGPALVVAPTSVGDNWVRETERFSPGLNPKLYREGNRQHLIESAGPGDLLIVSYQLVQRDARRFASRHWHTLVLDEAQFIKNAQTKTARAIRDIDADWRIALSGTPLENHLGELWSLMRTISPGLLGSWDRFRNRFADPIERHKDAERRESLARLVRPFILRRTKEKVLRELPPRTEITLQAHLSGEERQRYDDARMEALAELSGGIDQPGEHRMRTLAWLTKLRQLACHPRLVDRMWSRGSAKLTLLSSLIDELRDGDHRALIFSQFVKHLGLIRELLDERGITYQYLDGATPAKERQRRVDAFQAGEGDLFLISLKAGGTGLNLTAADYVIHLDPWWNPAVEDQATDRAHRIGQDRPVTVYRLVASGTIEEQILEMHADKRELVAGVLDGTDRAAKMETEDLIRLIKAGDLS
ncbi:DEAD/DEAH box helicase [Roseiconus nitratireducens]|uniref:DEAD/DEAH box helicase n=1 Tax=Roseiconus nitratireducens TaxID=2605748 RepID=A0A5M6DE94_9BACT|nr:DEAD/DEAH box helicase [Roseiconus nitratireducens]KAA5545854.1 DEAD/DEAH box helicase [Roseiconus nitratireducens]